MLTSDGDMPVEGVDYVTLLIVADARNPGMSKIYESHQYYHDGADRHPMALCVDTSAVFADQLEFFVNAVAYSKPQCGSLLLIGEIRDLVDGRFYQAEVFYTVHEDNSQCSGHLRVYLNPEEENLFGEPEQVEPIFGAIAAVPPIV